MINSFNLSQIFQKIQILGLCFAILTLPYAIALNNIGFFVFVFGVLGSFFTNINSYRISPVQKWILIFLFVYYFMQIIGISYTDNVTSGWHEVEVKILIPLLPLLLWSGQLSQKEYFIFIKIFILGILISLFYPLYQIYLIFSDKGVVTSLDVEPLLPFHRPFYGFYIASGIILLGQLIMRNAKKTWHKLAYLVLLIFFYLVLTIILSKAALILGAISILLFICLYISEKFTKVLLKAAPMLILLAIIATYLYLYYVLTDHMQSFYIHAINDTHVDYSLKNINSFYEFGINTRLVLWRCAWESWIDTSTSFFIGYGTGDSIAALVKCFTFYDQEFMRAYAFHSHNEFFMEALRHGIVGLGLWLGVLLTAFYIAIKRKSYTFSFFILSFILMSLSDTMLSAQKPVITFILLFAILGMEISLEKRQKIQIK